MYDVQPSGLCINAGFQWLGSFVSGFDPSVPDAQLHYGLDAQRPSTDGEKNLFHGFFYLTDLFLSPSNHEQKS